MINELYLNEIQSVFNIVRPKRSIIVAGRNYGKSTSFGVQMHNIIQAMPGASGIIAAKNYGHILTSVLPSVFAQLERMGYIKDIHYVIGKPFPNCWGAPYHPPVRKFENYITFFHSATQRAVGFDLRSQDKSSGRGPNRDFLLSDETLILDKDKMDKELFPTIRANKDIFKGINFHLGEFHSTSMPYTLDGKWILDEANYYINDFKIDIFAIWRQIVNLQIELLDITNPSDFKKQWNEIQRLRREIKPRLSKDGSTLFAFGNSLDNWKKDGGIKYLQDQRKRLPYQIFLIEIMNQIIDLTDNNFYSFDRDRHVYYDSFDNSFIQNLAENTNYDFQKLGAKNSQFLNKIYYNTNDPIIAGFDWGGTISFMLTCQKFKQDFETLYFQKEFYVKPDNAEGMIDQLMKQFITFYENHQNKTIIFLRDTFGDNSSTSINTNKTINKQAIKILEAAKWKVIDKRHPGKEPGQVEKWQLVNNCLKGEDKKYLKIKIDGNGCKNLILSIINTKSKQIDEKFSKDKSLERKKVDQATTTHATDAFDKVIFTLYKMTSNNMVPKVRH